MSSRQPNQQENDNATQQQQQQQQQRMLQMQQQQAAMQQAVQKFAGDYEIELEWPAVVMKTNEGSKPIRTSNELIQHRLMECGILYDTPISTKDVVSAATNFIENLEQSDCFHGIHVDIGETSSTISDPEGQHNCENDAKMLRRINIKLNEKNWYKFHAGAGLKTDGWLGASSTTLTGGSTSTTDAFLPTAEMELRAGLRNISGCLDRTDLQYSVDTQNIGSWTLTHVRPLYTVLPSTLSDALLLRSTGSQYAFTARAALDTSDRITLSSFYEYQRLLSVKASTSEQPKTNSPQNPWFSSIEYGILYRDLIPRRHATMPYHFAASPEIVAQSGASMKHAISGVTSYNNYSTDTSNLPVHGLQMQFSTEIALPPGDVGFVKGQVAVAGHLPIVPNRLALHTNVSSGYLHSITFGGLCGPPLISDRFLLGGIGSFRGFIPAGIGPRGRSVNNRTTNEGLGDALGGNLFYTASLMASLAPPDTIEGISQITRNVRLFGFTTVGSCVSVSNTTNWNDIIGSTRMSAGVGIASGALGPRIEATYTLPIRYGPIDGRRRFQLGVCISTV